VRNTIAILLFSALGFVTDLSAQSSGVTAPFTYVKSNGTILRSAGDTVWRHMKTSETSWRQVFSSDTIWEELTVAAGTRPIQKTWAIRGDSALLVSQTDTSGKTLAVSRQVLPLKYLLLTKKELDMYRRANQR